MTEPHQFCLRWNNFPDTMVGALDTLRNGEDFVDVTLACEGKSFKAHKIILSACSQYFHQLLKDNPCQHPIIILKDVGWVELSSLLQFMYHGQANIDQDRLGQLLQAAESLQIKGLAEVSSQQIKELDQTSQMNQCSEYFGPASIADALEDGYGNHDGNASGSDSSLQERKTSPPPASAPSPKRRKQLPMLQSILTGQKIHDGTGNEKLCSGNGTSNPGGSNSSGESYSPLKFALMSGNNSSTKIKVEKEDKELSSGENSELSEGQSPEDLSDKKGETSVLRQQLAAGETVLSAASKLQRVATSVITSVKMEQQPHPMVVLHSVSPISITDTSETPNRKLAFHEPRPCPVCKRMYRDAATLRTHTAIMHVEGQAPFYCTCGLPFRTKYEMYLHKKCGHK